MGIIGNTQGVSRAVRPAPKEIRKNVKRAVKSPSSTGSLLAKGFSKGSRSFTGISVSCTSSGTSFFIWTSSGPKASSACSFLSMSWPWLSRVFSGALAGEASFFSFSSFTAGSSVFFSPCFGGRIISSGCFSACFSPAAFTCSGLLVKLKSVSKGIHWPLTSEQI